MIICFSFFFGFLFGICIINKADNQNVESENNKVEITADNYSNE